MARPLRINIEDGWYHVFGRGNERREIYSERRDREHFLELLAEMHERYRLVIHAYALLDNHYHSIVQTPDANLSQAMQWLHGSYSTWFNVKHDRVGPLFQGRFRAVPVENSTWAYALSFYVHLNPLRIAGLGLDGQGRILEGKGFKKPSREQVAARLKRLRLYPWSSYRAYAGYAQAPEWLNCDELLSRAHRREVRQQAQYRADARQRLTCGVERSEIERLRDTVAIGAAEFAKTVRALAGEKELRGVEGKRELRRRVSLDEVRDAVESLKEEPWDTFLRRRGDWGRPLFLWAARRVCGRTLRELGGAAGGMDEAAVGMALRRFEQRCAHDRSLRKQREALIVLLDVKP